MGVKNNFTKYLKEVCFFIYIVFVGVFRICSVLLNISPQNISQPLLLCVELVPNSRVAFVMYEHQWIQKPHENRDHLSFKIVYSNYIYIPEGGGGHLGI